MVDDSRRKPEVGQLLALRSDALEKRRNLKNHNIIAFSHFAQKPFLVTGAIGDDETTSFAAVLIQRSGNIPKVRDVDVVPSARPQLTVEEAIVWLMRIGLNGIVPRGIDEVRVVGAEPCDERVCPMLGVLVRTPFIGPRCSFRSSTQPSSRQRKLKACSAMGPPTAWVRYSNRSPPADQRRSLTCGFVGVK